MSHLFIYLMTSGCKAEADRRREDGGGDADPVPVSPLQVHSRVAKGIEEAERWAS